LAKIKRDQTGSHYVNWLKPTFIEVVSHAIYLQNHAPTKALDGEIPHEAWMSKKPNVCHLHQQNPIHLNSLDRAVKRTIELRRLQKGAMLYSDVQLPAISVSLCGSAVCPKMETCTRCFLFLSPSVSGVIMHE
jgi:hypothetical protein